MLETATEVSELLVKCMPIMVELLALKLCVVSDRTFRTVMGLLSRQCSRLMLRMRPMRTGFVFPP